MSKVPPTLPGIPTDEVPLWQQIQDASKDIVVKAIAFERYCWPGEEYESPHLASLLEAVRLYNSLIARQDPSRPVGTK